MPSHTGKFNRPLIRPLPSLRRYEYAGHLCKIWDAPASGTPARRYSWAKANGHIGCHEGKLVVVRTMLDNASRVTRWWKWPVWPLSIWRWSATDPTHRWAGQPMPNNTESFTPWSTTLGLCHLVFCDLRALWLAHQKGMAGHRSKNKQRFYRSVDTLTAQRVLGRKATMNAAFAWDTPYL